MISKRQVFEIHRLKNLGMSNRKIAANLGINKDTVRKYIQEPEKSTGKKRIKSSKLDAYQEMIKGFLHDDPLVKAPVVLRKLRENGFTGGSTIVRDCLRQIRGQIKNRMPFIRFESPPGKQMQIDWGHFGTIAYGQTNRKLYALAVIECYSRMLYVEFTHSQKQEVLHQALLNAFRFFGGSPQELVVDNMLTAVREREGRIVAFNEAFLNFLRPLKIVPHACNVRAPQEKGKIERSIQYIRQNFLPLGTFRDLLDIQTQVVAWLNTVANVRDHQTTGEKPCRRFEKASLRPLPPLNEVKETMQVLVHSDFSVRFDGNSYSAPPWTIGKHLILKADQTSVQLYHHDKLITEHPRCWEKKKRLEIAAHTDQVKKTRKKNLESREVSIFAALGTEFREYLGGLAEHNQPVKKIVSKLLLLLDQYGKESLLIAVNKALKYKVYGDDYIENILYQEMTPVNEHPPVKTREENFNRIRLSEPSLSDYDALILQRRKQK